MPAALTIAGSDPSGGAGVQADLRVFAALDVTGLSAVTALTVQNSRGVLAVYPTEARHLSEQLEAILCDTRVAAVKIGMLGGAAQVRAVAESLREHHARNVVLDPVLASSDGVPMLDEEGLAALVHELLPQCAIVTPNLHEARVLCGVAAAEQVSEAEMAARLLAAGAGYVLIKGGHRARGQPDEPVTDILYSDGEPPYPVAGRWVDTLHTHGTGCMHASCVVACLAKGMPVRSAAACAKNLVSTALDMPIVAGRGRGYPDAAAAVRAGGRSHAERLGLLSGLYVLTDALLRPDRSPEEIARCALAGGATTVQLRDKRLPTDELIALARRLNGMARAAGALFIVNDRVDVALASDADGVHLGPGDMCAADARLLLGPARLIGVSVSSVRQAADLAPFASYLGVGAIYGSTTKLDAGDAVGPDRIREICAAFPDRPVVAIGGIGPGSIDAVWRAGARAAAVVSAVVCAANMEEAAAQLTRSFPSNCSPVHAPASREVTGIRARQPRPLL